MNIRRDLVTIPFTKKLTNDELRYLDDILAGFDRQLGLAADFLSSDAAAELAYANRQQIDAFFRNSGIREQYDNLIEFNAQSSQELIDEFYRIGAGLGFQQLDRTVAFTLADREALYNVTQYNFDLIRNVNDTLRGQIREVIFESVAEGHGYNTTMQRLLELPLEPVGNISVRTRAEMIARTEHARAVNTGTLQAYSDYGVGEVEIITAGDSLVCDTCIDYEDNNPYTLQEAMSLLPAHPNCRCAYAPVPDSLQSKPVSNPSVVDLTE